MHRKTGDMSRIKPASTGGKRCIQEVRGP